MVGVPKRIPSNRPRIQRFLYRRQFYPQLLKIIWRRPNASDRGIRLFVSPAGGIGDLVNCFPTVELLSKHYVVDIGPGPYPYRALVDHNSVYSPLVYKPIRRAHRRLEHTKAPADRPNRTLSVSDLEKIGLPVVTKLDLLAEDDKLSYPRDKIPRSAPKHVIIVPRAYRVLTS